MAWVFFLSGPTHGGPLFLLFESILRGTHGTKPYHQPPSAWQRSFSLENSSLPTLGEVVECFVLSQALGESGIQMSATKYIVNFDESD
jgi:hypothetical protein